MIKLSHVTKKIGEKIILDDVSLEIEGQEFISIIGASGAGKSTLLHLMIGADRTTEGQLYVDNFDLSNMSEKELALLRRKVGMVFQDYKLLASKTVYENVAFALEVCEYAQAFVEARTNEVLKLVGMYDQRKSFPHELSGGEKQKVALARALAGSPPLLLADEPTGNLDPAATEEIIELFQKINRMGTTVILATHNEKIVNTIKRRVIELKHGKIIRDKLVSGYKE